jgi:hypothetical protein
MSDAIAATAVRLRASTASAAREQSVEVVAQHHGGRLSAALAADDAGAQAVGERQQAC